MPAAALSQVQQRAGQPPVQLPRLLPLSGKRCKSEAEREHDREPDPPHGHLV